MPMSRCVYVCACVCVCACVVWGRREGVASQSSSPASQGRSFVAEVAGCHSSIPGARPAIAPSKGLVTQLKQPSFIMPTTTQRDARNRICAVVEINFILTGQPWNLQVRVFVCTKGNSQQERKGGVGPQRCDCRPSFRPHPVYCISFPAQQPRSHHHHHRHRHRHRHHADVAQSSLAVVVRVMHPPGHVVWHPCTAMMVLGPSQPQGTTRLVFSVQPGMGQRMGVQSAGCVVRITVGHGSDVLVGRGGRMMMLVVTTGGAGDDGGDAVLVLRVVDVRVGRGGRQASFLVRYTTSHPALGQSPPQGATSVAVGIEAGHPQPLVTVVTSRQSLSQSWAQPGFTMDLVMVGQAAAGPRAPASSRTAAAVTAAASCAVTILRCYC